MPIPKLIETTRLQLRPVATGDHNALWAIYSEPAVREFLMTRPETKEDFEHIFQAALTQSALGTLWIVTEAGSGAVLGRCGFFTYEKPHLPEFAILLTQTSWGVGLATEAATAALNFAIDDLRWAEVVAVTRPDNNRVRRVLAKLGFLERDTQEVRGAPAVRFGITAAQWREHPDSIE